MLVSIAVASLNVASLLAFVKSMSRVLLSLVCSGSVAMSGLAETIPHVSSKCFSMYRWLLPYTLHVCRWLVTHLGGFFIKRKLDTAAGKDVLYRRCLHEVRMLLCVD